MKDLDIFHLRCRVTHGDPIEMLKLVEDLSDAERVVLLPLMLDRLAGEHSLK